MGMCKWFLPLGPEGYCRPCTRRLRRRSRFFGYYTNMVQQIEFIIETFKPSWHFFYPKSKVQINSCYRHNLKNNNWISPFFYVNLPMSTEITWLDFQFSTNNQNGRHLAIIISFSTCFFLKPLETWYRYIGFQGLRVYWHCPFSCAIQTLDIVAILILSLIFYYWHNIYWKRLCQICGHFESVHQPSVFECFHSIF